MDREKLIELTNKLYKQTLLFPKKEPLRYKMREVADDILAFGKEKDLEVLKKYFEVAKRQNWVSYFDLLEIEEEYDKIKSDLPRAVQGPTSNELKKKRLDTRKEKILKVLKEKEKVQVWEIKEILAEVSKRTLRRDFEQLLKQGLIERIGERNDTFYKIKVGQERTEKCPT